MGSLGEWKVVYGHTRKDNFQNGRTTQLLVMSKVCMVCLPPICGLQVDLRVDNSSPVWGVGALSFAVAEWACIVL